MSENILEKIVLRKRETLARQKEAVPASVVQAVLEKDIAAARLREKIAREPRHLIAEVKKASPSAGVIRTEFDGVALAAALEKGGASAISVLTEEDFFQGSLALFDAVRAAVKVPLLRKDFIVDTYQLYESKLHGADAVLLIAAILDPGRLKQFVHLCDRLKLDALVEVHDVAQLTKALNAGAAFIGINARDLTDFSVRLDRVPHVLQHVPPHCQVVVESGIKTKEDIDFVKTLTQVRAVLVGEALMRAADPEQAAREFIWTLRK
ncbi:MAG: indole-3-glycerol phosphate synthase TrpC [Deltaproteobacteria bacterium]